MGQLMLDVRLPVVSGADAWRSVALVVLLAILALLLSWPFETCAAGKLRWVGVQRFWNRRCTGRRIVEAWRALESSLPPEASARLSNLSEAQIKEVLLNAVEPLLPMGQPVLELHLAVDIGATRTKFMLQRGDTERVMLDPVLSRYLWTDEDLPGEDKSDPGSAAARMAAYFRACGVPLAMLQRVVFSVPGTVDIEEMTYPSEPVLVRNMPSFSPKFRGFNFKAEFSSVFPNAKITAVPDNMAAALGVACTASSVQNALVLVLGTAPAVATFFRDPTKQHKYVESAIWQSWVWFTKIDLQDPYGYCGGVQLGDDGRTLRLRSKTQYKIPHHQARIRFALDNATWERLRGRSKDVPAAVQGHLDEEAATEVWCTRLRAALSALVLKFHSVYGPPEVVYVLGGNATRCHGKIMNTSYSIPDSAKGLCKTVPVVIPSTDEEQQRICLSGLLYSARFKARRAWRPRGASPYPLAHRRPLGAGEARLRVGPGPSGPRLDPGG